MTRKQDIEHAESIDAICYLGAVEGLVCDRCGSGEIHQPMQPLVLPRRYECLLCGNSFTTDK